MNKYSTISTIVTKGLEQNGQSEFCRIILRHCSRGRVQLEAPLLFWFATECCSPCLCVFLCRGGDCVMVPVPVLQFTRQTDEE